MWSCSNWVTYTVIYLKHRRDRYLNRKHDTGPTVSMNSCHYRYRAYRKSNQRLCSLCCQSRVSGFLSFPMICLFFSVVTCKSICYVLSACSAVWLRKVEFWGFSSIWRKITNLDYKPECGFNLQYKCRRVKRVVMIYSNMPFNSRCFNMFK